LVRATTSTWMSAGLFGLCSWKKSLWSWWAMVPFKVPPSGSERGGRAATVSASGLLAKVISGVDDSRSKKFAPWIGVAVVGASGSNITTKPALVAVM